MILLDRTRLIALPCVSYLCKIGVSFIFLILFTSCNRQLVSNRSLNSDVIIQEGKNIPLITSKFFEDTNNHESLSDYSNSNYISILKLLPHDFVLWGISNINMDPNFFDEYVIAYSTRNDAVVRILVSKYDMETENYYFVWQFTTTFLGDEHVNLYAKDVTGDFQNEIIVIGNDTDNKRAIEVFKANDTIGDYKNIFSANGDEIEIVETDNQYNEDEVVYPLQYQIVVTSKNDDTEIVKKFFKWSTNNNTFVLIDIVRNSVDDLRQEKIARLKNASEAELKAYLQGYWVKKSENGDENDEGLAIIFSNDSEQITFIEKNSALIYSWKSFFRTISNYGGTALQINIKSKILPSLFNWVRVEIFLQDEIFIAVNEDFPLHFNGAFFKVDAITETNSHLFSSSNTFVLTPASKSVLENFSGHFTNQKMQEVYIVRYPRIRKIVGNIETVYYYKIFDLNNNTGIELLEPNVSSEFYFIENTDNESWTLYPVLIYADAYYLDFKKNAIVLETE